VSVPANLQRSLTEVFATFWRPSLLRPGNCDKKSAEADFLLKCTHLPRERASNVPLGAGLIVGWAAISAETPLLLIAGRHFWRIVFSPRNIRRWFWVLLAMALGCLMILSPWATRNMVTLGEPQFLAPKNSISPEN